MEIKSKQFSEGTPEIVDVFTWEKYDKIITQDVHKVPGLGNFTHFAHRSSQSPTPPHYHMDMMEIHCIVRGRRDTRIYLNDKDTEDVIVTGNEALIIFPNEIHSSGEIRPSPYEVYALQLNTISDGPFLGLDGDYAEALRQRLRNISHRRVHLDPSGFQLLKRAFDLFTTGDPRAGTAYIVCFLSEFSTMSDQLENVQKSKDERILKILEYISENIYEQLPLEDLARMSGYSLSRFKSKFREETGHTPGAYITASKVETAKILLRTSDRSITEIAIDLGWSTSNYFCSVFKKLTGISPLNYRRSNPLL